MKKRFLTSFVLLSIAYCLFFLLPPIFYLLFVWLVSLLICYETVSIANKPAFPKVKLIAVLFLNSIVFYLSYLIFKDSFGKTPDLSFSFLIIPLVLAGIELYKKRFVFEKNQTLFLLRISILSSISLPISAIFLKKELSLLLIFLLTIWITDSAALFFGKYFGKTPLSVLSPKKTMEGSLYSNLFCLAIACIAWYFLEFSWVLIPCVFITNILAQYGDLHESLFKRNFGAKNSGNLLPGHGGFYDRSDSILLASPVFFLIGPFI